MSVATTTSSPVQGARPTEERALPPPGRSVRLRRWVSRRPALLGSVFMAPAALVLLAFWAIPLALVVAFSFFHWTDGTQPRFNGLNEYRELFSSGLFWHSLVLTVIFALATVLIGTLVSLVLALLVRSVLYAAGLFRAIYFLPYVTPIVATSTVWLWIYQPSTGVLDRTLSAVGLPGSIAWVSYPDLALASLIIYTIWYSFGFTTLLFLAGLTDIPVDCVEAAHLDGASTWQRLRWVVLPLLSPTTLFVIVIDTIAAFQAFTQIYALTNGGPINGTTTLTYLIYQLSFQYFHFGQASSAATIFVLLVGLLVLVQFRLVRHNRRYS
ncbi:MAG: carbohydrate ABC transporter permease [Acidimicrobiales bacterium]